MGKHLIPAAIWLASILAWEGISRGIDMLDNEPRLTCIKGVEYIEFSSGATPELTPDGKITRCHDGR